MKNLFLHFKSTKRRQILSLFSIIFAIGVTTSHSRADWDRSPASSRNAGPSRSHSGDREQRVSLEQDASANSADVPDIKSRAGMNRQLEDLMRNSNDPNLSWPPLPRQWIEWYENESETQTTSVGLDGIARVGSKRTAEVKYVVKTSFILIGSDRKINDPVNPTHGSAANDYLLRPALASDKDDIIRFDEATLANYPQIRPGYPMVGICVFEPSMTHEVNDNFGINMFIAQKSLTYGKVKGINTPYFSNFIQLDGKIPIFHYQKTVCGEMFRSQVEKKVMRVFHSLVREMMARSKLPGLCNPNIGNSECDEWKKENILPGLQDKIVARCEKDPALGYFRCVPKGLRNMGCSIYTDPDKGTFSDKYSFNEHRILVTHGHHEFTCDEKSGLTCEFYNKPSLTVLGRPFLKGAAQCVRK